MDVTLRISTSRAGRARLLSRLTAGNGEFMLTARDGTLSVRASLSVAEVADTAAAEPRSASSVQIDWARSLLVNGDNRLVLSRTESRLLAALVEAEGRVVSKSDLASMLWPDWQAPPTEREASLAQYVAELRKRLAAVGLPEALQAPTNGSYCIRF